MLFSDSEEAHLSGAQFIADGGANNGVTVVAAPFVCPGCLHDCGLQRTNFIRHLRTKHPDPAEAVAAYRVPACPELVRCPRDGCWWWCMNGNGLRKHRCKASGGSATAGDAQHVALSAGNSLSTVATGEDIPASGAMLSMTQSSTTSAAGARQSAGASSAAVPCHPTVPEDPLSVAARERLADAYNTGLYTVWQQWRSRMRPVLLRLLDNIGVGSGGAQLEHELSTAFALLPGIVVEARLQRRGRIKDLLDRFAAKAPAVLPVRDLALDIIAVAQKWLPETLSRRQLLREAAVERPPPSEASIRKRLESFVRDRCLSSAMAALEHLQDVLDAHDAGEEPVVRGQLSTEAAMQEISELNPPPTCMMPSRRNKRQLLPQLNRSRSPPTSSSLC